MSELELAGFWRTRFTGAASQAESKLEGWKSSATSPDGFVEPKLKILEGDPHTARILIIAAPGAVGKSSYARALAAATNSVVVDLAATAPLGGHFFTGALSNAFDAAALVQVATGRIGLIVDALDEAQMRAGPKGYEAGLDDLACLTLTDKALPAVLLGRAIAAEDAYLYLAGQGRAVCLLEIQFFDDDQARRYIEGKLPLVAARNEQLKTAYQSHVGPYRELAHHARERLIETAGSDRERFAGYAPVLDAICEFTMQDGCGNPKSRIEDLCGSSPIELIRDIIISILRREQGKVRAQFAQRHPDASDAVLDGMYTPDEQLTRISAQLLETTPWVVPDLPSHDFRTTYLEMVEQFGPQHPFMSTGRAASNPIFAAFVMAWALKRPQDAAIARRMATNHPALTSPILFELYDCALDGDPPHMPLADVGLLYQALNSRIAPGQRVQLEILSDGEDNGAIEVFFEILERADDDSDEVFGDKCWGPYETSSATELELRSPLSNIFIYAPIVVRLGDGVTQQIAAPTEIDVEWLRISAMQLLVASAGADAAAEMQTVALIARDTESSVRDVTARDDVSLSVSWPAAEAYPWNRYAVQVVPPFDEDVGFLRRRLRNILTAFRSHSKGALRRLAAKINHSRMIKDERGAALLRHLLEDEILVPVLSGKFYELNSGVMGAKLFVSYNDLAHSRFSPELDSYLMTVIQKLRKAAK